MTKHLVWDWNGTLLDDLSIVITATNAAFATMGAPPTTADEHRRDFRRPITAYYELVLGRAITYDEFAALDRVFHDVYRAELASAALAADAEQAMTAWPGTQSLLSMWFHHELVPLVTQFGLMQRFLRVDGLRAEVGGGHKAEHLRRHLAEQALDGEDVVLIGDSVDDAHAAAEVGAACVLYTGGFTAESALHECGVPVARTLLDAVALASR